jgi:bifunctional non-homologous end joining protein LigD
VEPELVAEVKFAQWTAGHVVRAAVFLGLRTDKDPTTIVRET